MLPRPVVRQFRRVMAMDPRLLMDLAGWMHRNRVARDEVRGPEIQDAPSTGVAYHLQPIRKVGGCGSLLP